MGVLVRKDSNSFYFYSKWRESHPFFPFSPIDANPSSQSVDFAFLSRVTSSCSRADSDVEFWADHSSDDDDDEEEDESEEEGVEIEFEEEDREVRQQLKH